MKSYKDCVFLVDSDTDGPVIDGQRLEAWNLYINPDALGMAPRSDHSSLDRDPAARALLQALHEAIGGCQHHIRLLGAVNDSSDQTLLFGFSRSFTFPTSRYCPLQVFYILRPHELGFARPVVVAWPATGTVKPYPPEVTALMELLYKVTCQAVDAWQAWARGGE